jgi:hypothetical protein
MRIASEVVFTVCEVQSDVLHNDLICINSESKMLDACVYVAVQIVLGAGS